MKDDRLLLAFALGSFHAALLTMLLVLPFYLLGGLGDILDGLSTLLGLAAFGALWTTSVYATYRGIGAAELEPGQPAAASRLLNAGETWGAWNGVLFFWCLLTGGVVALMVRAANEGVEQLYGVIVFGLAGLAIGSVFAALIGGFFGFMTALLEVGLLKLARSLVGANTP